MRLLKLFLLIILVSTAASATAKKYKWTYNSHPLEVYTTGQGQKRTQLVKAWAIAKNADKAILQAKMDAVSAALFTGIDYDEKTHGMGVSNLKPLVTPEKYEEFKSLFQDFFQQGTFLEFVRDINSAYPTGENNVSVDGGRKVGVNLIIDYPALRKWLEDNGINKGLGDHFHK